MIECGMNVPTEYRLYQDQDGQIYLELMGDVFRWLQKPNLWWSEIAYEWPNNKIPIEQWTQIDRLTFLVIVGVAIESAVPRWMMERE